MLTRRDFLKDVFMLGVALALPVTALHSLRGKPIYVAGDWTFYDLRDFLHISGTSGDMDGVYRIKKIDGRGMTMELA